MTDRELLEWAAKAAGLEIQWERDLAFPFQERWQALIKCGWDGQPSYREWNPLREDGDALRLAVNLGMSVDIEKDEVTTWAYAGEIPRAHAALMWHGDPYAATRRAIVRAAAEIGKAMP